MAAHDESTAGLRATPLVDRHRQLGARLVPFAGFSMPVQYSGLVAEHLAVRRAAGLFDVSHMGEFEIHGPDAAALCDAVTPSRISALEPGRAAYTALLTDEATFVDDILVYRIEERRFLLVVNASNIEKDFDWIRSRAGGLDAAVEDRSETTALLALQGPGSREILARITSEADPLRMKYYRVSAARVAGRAATLARTGYTGEIGFEIFVGADDAVTVWDALLDAGSDLGLLPVGLGARDTLRLEAGLPLYGNDIDEGTDVLAAGLEFIVDWDKGDFVGRAALAGLRERGPASRRVGISFTGRGIARRGAAVHHGGREIAAVTSGSWAPFLEQSIAMAYVPPDLAAPGVEVEAEVRGRRIPGETVKLPFYKRPRARPRGGRRWRRGGAEPVRCIEHGGD